jgi:hypothetical protein
LAFAQFYCIEPIPYEVIGIKGSYGVSEPLLFIMRRRLEIMAKSKTAKNGHERISTDRDRIRHLEYFMNGQWRHSSKCKEFTNKECMVRAKVGSFS